MTSTSSADGRAFSRDVLWNVAGLGVAGAVGILLNYLVSVVYGAAALGVFNQVYAAYVLFSQLAALGFHYSVLRYAAPAENAHERVAIVTTALIATGAVAIVFTALLWVLAEPVGRLLGSDEVGRGIRYAAPGVLFFALSKVTLGCLNALQRMRWYAILFGGRLVFMLAAFIACAALDVESGALPAILTLGEAATFLLSLVPVAGQLGRVSRAQLRRWIWEHLRFGIKGFMSGMLTVLNTRIDVLILGYFAADRIVGAYSFASILAEGLYQILVVLRTNYAPVVVKLWAEGRTGELLATIRRGRNRTYLGSIGVGALAVACYALLVPLVTSDPELAHSSVYFALLMAGIVASAGYGPFLPILLYAGMPGWQAWLMIAILAANAAANVLFVSMWGALGAAVATAIAFVLGAILLRAFAIWKLALRI